jgi:hypothetical protein
MALPRVVDSREKRLSEGSSGGGFSFKNMPTWVWYAGGAIIVVVGFLWITKGSSGTPLSVPASAGQGTGADLGATGSTGVSTGSGGSTGSSSGGVSGSSGGTSSVGSTSSGFVTPLSNGSGVAANGNTTSPVISGLGGLSSGVIQSGPLAGISQQGPSPASQPKIIGGLYGPSLGPGGVIQAGPLKGVKQQGPSPASHSKIIGGLYGPSLASGGVIQAGPLKGITQQGPSPRLAPKRIVGPAPMKQFITPTGLKVTPGTTRGGYSL